MFRDDKAISREYSRWMENTSGKFFEELKALSPEELRESFAMDLEFGTGGLRGKLGVGTNRMNLFTVTRATLGFGKWILETSRSPSVVIAHDTRHMSAEFAGISADVLSSMGIKVFLFSEPTPTPILSYAVREMKASGGIVITASHNPSQYNGYKVYTSDGTQAVPRYAQAIIERVKDSDFFEGYIPKKELIGTVQRSLFDKYVETIKKTIRNLCDDYEPMKVVYTPLHGTGNYPVNRVLSDLGHRVLLVKEQAVPDGDFPTVRYPNPEDPGTFEMALEIARENESDIILATDPDADRVGLMVRHDGEYTLLNGNQTGVVMTAFVLEMLEERVPERAFIVKTIVTTDLAKRIAAGYGVDLKETLTGFKFIGELIERAETTGDGEFVFGFEESYGYLLGRHARDKDAIVASALACTVGGFLKKKGLTVVDYLQQIYERYGFFVEDLVNKEYEGIEGKKKIDSIMDRLRKESPTEFKGRKLLRLIDYDVDGGDLPRADVLSMEFEGDCKLIVRPSGTEPKIKFYLMVRGSCEDEARKTIRELKELVEGIVA